jgi:hypothetical protein
VCSARADPRDVDGDTRALALPRHGAAVAKKAFVRGKQRTAPNPPEWMHSIGSLAIHRWLQWTHGFASPPYDGFAFFANYLL